MPIKEYECRACGNKFESLLMLNEPDPTACPKCGKADLKRILSTFRVAGLHKKSAESGEAMGDLGGGMPGGMPDGLDMSGDAGMDEMGGGMGMGGDEGGDMPMDDGPSGPEESS